jgi:hypothetical protein
MLRSLLLALGLVMSVSACAKKKAPASPANTAPTDAPGGGEGGATDEAKPDDPDDAEKLGADPCDGGE